MNSRAHVRTQFWLTVLLAGSAIYCPTGQFARWHGLAKVGGHVFHGVMPRAAARFRISIKDRKVGTHLKVELIEAPGLWGERRYKLRVNGSEPGRIKEATLTVLFDRLRRWLVTQAEKN